MTTGRVLSVQVGPARPLATGRGEVASGIVKREVAGRIAVGALGLAGDEQADLTVHGGLAKAVYAYPVEHYAFWQARQAEWGVSPGLRNGALGENLTIAGVLEADLYVGDELCFPDCTLRVTQPRHPCFKLNAVLQSEDAARSMSRSGYCGYYLAVDVPGTVAAGEAFTVRAGARHTPLLSLFKFARPRGS